MTAVTGTPEHGDVVIHGAHDGTALAYLVRAVPGPDQLSCATRAEAKRLAGAYAAHARVNVWMAQTSNVFTLVARCRRLERGRLRLAGRIHQRQGGRPIARNA